MSSDTCTDGTYRKQAPKLCNGYHPDWSVLSSGGIDSTAAYLIAKDALHENYGKRPLLIYLDTRIGLPRQRLYVEQLADAYGEQLWTLRTHEKFEDRIAKRGKFADRDDSGAPGASLHSDVQNELKGRQRETLNSRFSNLICVTGIRADESDERAKFPKAEESRGIQYVKPVYELSKKECARIILEHEDCPINPEWTANHFTDCACLSNGEPGELDSVEEKFPAFGQRIREYEEAIPDDGLRSVLGWDGLTAMEKAARENGQRQLSLCGGGCQREVPTPIQRAFEAVEAGATRDEGIAILDGKKSGNPDLVAATDGGNDCEVHTATEQEDR